MPRPAPSRQTATTQTPPANYREAYSTLSRIAAELETGEADLDRVLPLIQEAQAAYAVCRERIEALREALGAGEIELDEEAEEED
jgi:exodeoxyribonuclease VII small subunit